MGVKHGISLDGLVEYFFDAKVNMTSSISKFWFEVDEGGGSLPVRIDNDGKGLLIDQDTVLFDPAQSSFFRENNSPMMNVIVAECKIKVYIKVPMLPPFNVGTLAGDLDSGVGIKVKIPRVSGSITLYARGRYLYIAFVLDVFGKRFEVDLKVMPLPFLGYNAAKQANGAAVDQNLAQGAQGRAITAAA
ncbi:hypothetical protein PM082_002235 [Marasmius tenuissimus]|nr:hypothetical protein PM082_002235 [Marasmius tenuissimus]